MYTVIVERCFESESVELEIEASSQDEAEDRAVATAKKNEGQYFGSRRGIATSFEVVEIYTEEGDAG
jgi:hypothetical protein